MLIKRFNLSRSYEIRLASPELFEQYRYLPYNGGHVYLVLRPTVNTDVHTAVTSANLFKWAKKSDLANLGEEPIVMLADVVVAGARSGVPFNDAGIIIGNEGDYSSCTPIVREWENLSTGETYIGSNPPFKYPLDGGSEDYRVRVVSSSCSSMSSYTNFTLNGSAPSHLSTMGTTIEVLDGSCNDTSIVKGTNALIELFIGQSNDGIVSIESITYSIQGTTHGTIETSGSGMFTVGDLNVPTNATESTLTLFVNVILVGSTVEREVVYELDLMDNGDLDQDFLAGAMDVGIWDQPIYTLYFNEVTAYTITAPIWGGDIPTSNMKYRITWTQSNNVDDGVPPTQAGPLQNFGQEYEFTPDVEAMGNQMIACVKVIMNDCMPKSINVNCISFVTVAAPHIWAIDGSDGNMNSTNSCIGQYEQNIQANIVISGGSTTPGNRFTPASDVDWLVTLPANCQAKINSVWITGSFYVQSNVTVPVKSSVFGNIDFTYQATVALDPTVVDPTVHTYRIVMYQAVVPSGWFMLINGAASNTATPLIKGQPVYYKILRITFSDGTFTTSGSVRVIWRQKTNPAAYGVATALSPSKQLNTWYSQSTSPTQANETNVNIYYVSSSCPARNKSIPLWERALLGNAYVTPNPYRLPLANERYRYDVYGFCMGRRKYHEPPELINSPSGDDLVFSATALGIFDNNGVFRNMEIWVDIANNEGYEGKAHMQYRSGGGTLSGGIYKFNTSMDIVLRATTSGISMFKSRLVPQGKPTHGTKWVKHNVDGSNCPWSSGLYTAPNPSTFEVDTSRYGEKLITAGGHLHEGKVGVQSNTEPVYVRSASNHRGFGGSGKYSGTHFEAHFPSTVAQVGGGVSISGTSTLGGTILTMNHLEWVHFYFAYGVETSKVRIYQVANLIGSPRSGGYIEKTFYNHQNSPTLLYCSYKPISGAQWTMSAGNYQPFTFDEGKQYPSIGDSAVYRINSRIPLTYSAYGSSPVPFYGFGWITQYYWFGYDSSLPVLVDANGNGPRAFNDNKGKLRIILPGLGQEYITLSLMKFAVISNTAKCTFSRVVQFSTTAGGNMTERWPSSSGVSTSPIAANPAGRPTINFTVSEPGSSVPSGYKRLCRVYYTSNTGNGSAVLSASGIVKQNWDVQRIPPNSTITLSPPGPNCIITLRIEWGYFSLATDRYRGKCNQVTRTISYS